MAEYSKLNIFTQQDMSILEQATTDLEKSLILDRIREDYDTISSVHQSDLFDTVTGGKSATEELKDLYPMIIDKALREYQSHPKSVDIHNVREVYIDIVKENFLKGSFNEHIENSLGGRKHISFTWKPSTNEHNIWTPLLYSYIDELGSAIHDCEYHHDIDKETLKEKIECIHKEVIELENIKTDFRNKLQQAVETIDMQLYVEQALNAGCNNSDLLSEFLQLVQTTIDEDEEIRKLKQRIKDSQNLFDNYYDVEVSDYDVLPNEDIFVEVATEVGINSDDLNIEAIQQEMLYTIPQSIDAQMHFRGFSTENISFFEGYSGYYNLTPKFELYTSDYTPEDSHIGLADYFVESLPSKDSDEIQSMIESVKSDGLKPLYNYYGYGDGLISFVIGGEEYSDLYSASEDIEKWIKQMSDIEGYMEIHNEFATESAKRELVHTDLGILFDIED